MPFISLTRLRIRSIRFLPFFFIHTTRSMRQVRRAPGFLAGALLPDKHLTFWTMTAWDSEESMRQFMISGAHKAAMTHLIHWCDEASVTHWTHPSLHSPVGKKRTGASAKAAAPPRSNTRAPTMPA